MPAESPKNSFKHLFDETNHPRSLSLPDSKAMARSYESTNDPTEVHSESNHSFTLDSDILSSYSLRTWHEDKVCNVVDPHINPVGVKTSAVRDESNNTSGWVAARNEAIPRKLTNILTVVLSSDCTHLLYVPAVESTCK